jgi:hypothetical protein
MIASRLSDHIRMAAGPESGAELPEPAPRQTSSPAIDNGEALFLDQARNGRIGGFSDQNMSSNSKNSSPDSSKRRT